MMKIFPNSFHWKLIKEAKENNLQVVCDILNALTDEQKEAVELWVTSNCNEAREDEQNCNLMP
jgi:hypothetical protein